jgi:chitinase
MKKIIFSFVLFLIVFFQINAQVLKTEFCGKKMIGYVTNWSVNNDIDYAHLTHAFFSFLKPSGNGDLLEYTMEQESALSDFIRQTKKHGCKRFISLGGGGDQFFPIMAANTETRKNFISNVIEFCKNNKFDGIDMDWEAMDNEAQKKNYTALMKEFRPALSDAGLGFTATIGFGDYWCKWIENEALQQTDWIQLMIYDQTGTWSASPFGNHASFEHYVQAQQYWVNRGFTKDKIVLGLPLYGYKFASESGGQGTSQKYSEIVSAFPELAPSDDQTPGSDWCFFNGPDMIRKKTAYALDNGFAGVMVWEMSQDTQDKKSLHKAIMEAFAGYCAKK